MFLGKNMNLIDIIDTARKALKEIPISDILRERMSLALDQASNLESKIQEKDVLVGELRAQLKEIDSHRDKIQRELDRLKSEMAEDVKIIHGLEFRRGKRTDGKWMPFCPKCHLPAANDPKTFKWPFCTDQARCGWYGAEVCSSLSAWISELPNDTSTRLN